MTVTVRLPPASVRVLAVASDQAIRVSIPGSTGGSGGGGGAVSSVFGRTGDVTAQSGDYALAQITGLQDALDAKASQAFVLTAVDPYNVAFTGTGGQANVGDALTWIDGQIAGLYSDLTGKAGLFSPSFTGTPLAPTATGGTNTTQIATTAFVQGAVNAIIAAADAMVFKGVVDCSTNPDYPAADRGWTYKVSVSGKIGGASGVNVEAGDTLLCLTDGTASGDHATVGAQWNITQANLDGAVIGPVSSVDQYFALFSGTSGKLLTSVSPTAVKAALAITAGDVSGLDAAIAANSAVQANTAKVTNQTHTGDVTGSGALTIAATAISGKASAGALTGTEEVLVNDGGSLAKTTTQDIANLGGGGATVSQAISADQSDFNPTGWGANISVLNLEPTTSAFIGGLVATSDGHTVQIVNNSDFLVCLIEEDSDSTAANRFAHEHGSFYLLPDEAITVRYSARVDRWERVAATREMFAVGQISQLILPFSTSTQSLIGKGAITNTATLSTVGLTASPANDFEENPYWQATNSTGSGSSNVRAGPANLFHRGAVSGRNGFLFHSRVRFTALGATGGVMVGLTSTTGNITTQPSTVVNSLMLGADGGQTTLRIFSGDASAGTPVDLGANFPVPDATAAYEVAFYAPGGGSTVEYLVRRIDTRFVANGTLSANIPINTQVVGPRTGVMVGATATASTIQANYLYAIGL